MVLPFNIICQTTCMKLHEFKDAYYTKIRFLFQLNKDIYDFLWEHANEYKAFDLIVNKFYCLYDGRTITLNNDEQMLFKRILLETGTIYEKIGYPNKIDTDVYGKIRTIALYYNPMLSVQFGFKNKVWSLIMDVTGKLTFEDYCQLFPRDPEIIKDLLNSIDQLSPIHIGYFTAINEFLKLKEENQALRALPGGSDYQAALARFDAAKIE